VIFADRAQFRLDHADLRGALADFRDAHRLAALMRADIVPADQDRVTFESGLSRIGAGLVDAGNRLAQQTSDRAFLKETFDIAEEDRFWSLRALVPASHDWRTRLPAGYWDLLARYQSIERGLVAQPSAEKQRRASALQLELQEIEASAVLGADASRPDPAQSALAHVRSVLDRDSVLFSFYVTKAGGWLWAVDRGGVDVFPIPSLENLKSSVADFTRAAREGDPRAVALGGRLYKDLFGAVPAVYLTHKRWLLELDGPLFDLPFASLVVDIGKEIRKNEPIYLIERAALQAIPGALMLEPLKRRDPRAASSNASFLGIGDPVYNAADNRYQGNRNKKPDMALPRLPATAEELQACSRAWGSAETRILTGRNADLASVRAALQSNPSVIHFATHVVASPEDHSSGLIALSLDRSGAMGLMGPTEIVAHSVSASLVVLNGCHSGQGDELPGAGLMGLTRAWIGAGARSVLATRWDIPDEAGKTVMVEFYRALRAHPASGAAFALKQAQLAALKENDLQSSRSNTAIWAAYFLLGRE
jgi:CHAT domain-containing protein